VGGGLNNGGEVLQKIVDARLPLEQLAKLDCDVELRLDFQTVSVWWFYYHREHEIAVFSEYGQRWVKP
jgi:hypothetical protein